MLMRLLIALEQRFLRAADGNIYTAALPRYEFWCQYLRTFEEVVVLARVGETAQFQPAQQRADGPGVTFWRLPNYLGPMGYLRNLVRLRFEIRRAVAGCDRYILRLPGAIGDMAAREIRRLGREYAVQVLGDPWEVFSPGAVRTPLRPLYRRLMTRSLLRNCSQAAAASYVTKQTLQRRYPAGAGAYTCSLSDVVLGGRLADVETIEKRKRRARELAAGCRRPVRLGFAGSLEVHYKGADVLVKAVAVCLRQGLSVEAHLAGDGRSRPQFESLARELGISRFVHFHGQLPAGDAVFDFLDSIDIFVMPSRTEGLPCALVEAMARGCPCIASAVGGIPELLVPEALVPPSDEGQLAVAIERFVGNRELLLRMIERNLEVAKGYRPELLTETRSRFLSEVRARVAAGNLYSVPRHRGQGMQINREPLSKKRDYCASPVRTALAVTSAMGWIFFEEIVRALRDGGFDPVLISSPGQQLQDTAEKAGVHYAAIPMSREIAPLSDLRSLWRLYQFMRRARPTITNVGTPKAGLLGGLAAWLSGVPCRIYTLHGLRLETTVGWKRTLLRCTERLACSCAHRVICVSPSVRQRAVELKVVSAGKTAIMGSGSSCGVDVQRFSPQVVNYANRLAKRLGIPNSVPVIGFVGRFTRDKGIPELVAAFGQLRQAWPELRLLLVGDFEDGDPVPPGIQQQIETDSHIVCTGFVTDAAPYYGLMEVLALPTYREGFPVVSIEAQACGVPVVTTTATGAIDSIVDGVTGFVVAVGDAQALAARIDQLLRDPQLRACMGQRGRALVVREFRQEVVGQALLEEYRRMLRSKRLTLPRERAEALAADQA
jgi:glycosyltransferase involved in cell wall biosynthesis